MVFILYKKNLDDTYATYCELGISIKDLRNFLEKTGKINKGAPLSYFTTDLKRHDLDGHQTLSELSEKENIASFITGKRRRELAQKNAKLKEMQTNERLEDQYSHRPSVITPIPSPADICFAHKDTYGNKH